MYMTLFELKTFTGDFHEAFADCCNKFGTVFSLHKVIVAHCIFSLPHDHLLTAWLWLDGKTFYNSVRVFPWLIIVTHSTIANWFLAVSGNSFVFLFQIITRVELLLHWWPKMFFWRMQVLCQAFPPLALSAIKAELKTIDYLDPI